jgi:hypothetical protein
VSELRSIGSIEKAREGKAKAEEKYTVKNKKKKLPDPSSGSTPSSCHALRAQCPNTVGLRGGKLAPVKVKIS